MITENYHWSVSCENCGEDLDMSSAECYAPIDDEAGVIDYICDLTEWVYDEDSGEVFCCEECRDEWKKEFGK